MSEPIIRVENLGKKYSIRHEHPERYTALRDVLAQRARKLFSFPKHLRPNLPVSDYEDFWALKDLNFEIQQGDRVGIIGRNGAGKSTLLKILSRITEPTTGRIELNGRVASLLEVGTGFHPELTGRENIFLNGAILGMSRQEIKSKFDEIVDFSGVEQFLDTPVKRYSSGMYVRLAFAVAAHLEPEILVVDEVLAVGDAEFQKKCLGKMEEVSKEEGRTVLFVSHNLGMIQAICSKALMIHSGEILKTGNPIEVINHYNSFSEMTEIQPYISKGTLKKEISIQKITINNSQLANIQIIPDENIRIRIFGNSKRNLDNTIFQLAIHYNSIRIFTLESNEFGEFLFKGEFSHEFNITNNFLRPGTYQFSIAILSNRIDWFWLPDIGSFSILEIWTDKMKKSEEGVINYTNAKH